MVLADVFDNRVKLLFLGLKDRVRLVLSRNRRVGRNLDDVHAVGVAELLLLGQSGTRHTCLLLELIEEVLEGDGREGLGLLAHVHVLLRLDGLVQAVGETSARHDAAGELIDNQDLVVFHDIVLVAVHEFLRAER